MARFPEKDGRDSESPAAVLLPFFLIFCLGCDCSEVRIEGDAASDSPGPRCPEGMAYVPAGDFVMGCDPDDVEPINCFPEHIVTMSAYCIDIVPVNNALWMDCVEAGGCEEPFFFKSYTREDYFGNPAYDNYPVLYVEWDWAQAYCRRLGKSLPTEAQWEKAARGGCELGGDPYTCDDPEDEREYPWGNEPPSCDRLEFCASECCIGDSNEVGIYPLAASPYGVLDMEGNVNEIMLDFYELDYYSTGGPPWVDPKGPEEGTYHTWRGGGTQRLYPLTHRMLGDYGGLRCASAPYY